MHPLVSKTRLELELVFLLFRSCFDWPGDRGLAAVATFVGGMWRRQPRSVGSWECAFICWAVSRPFKFILTMRAYDNYSMTTGSWTWHSMKFAPCPSSANGRVSCILMCCQMHSIIFTCWTGRTHCVEETLLYVLNKHNECIPLFSGEQTQCILIITTACAEEAQRIALKKRMLSSIRKKTFRKHKTSSVELL